MSTRCLDTKKMGENIKRLIKESEFRTQENFAAACIDNYLVNTNELDSSQRIVNRWLNGGISKLSLVYDIANLLNVDVGAILS
ncbi:MAG: hypothetical protein IJ309_02995 [Clostridia bacterium]|nr:hypothetical protein [Clostridia bacterium]